MWLVSFCSQFGVVDAGGKVEAGEMDVERSTTCPLNLDNHFLPVQSTQRADSRMVFPCALKGQGKNGREVGARIVHLPLSVGVTATV
jgi:hypothetical protein